MAKTRSQAATEVNKGKIRLNGSSVKAAKEVKLGDEIQVIKHTSTFSFRVIELLDKRVGAKLVANYIVDITSPEEIEKFKTYQMSQKAYRFDGSGKPNKKDRRDLDDFLENWPEL